MAELIGLDDNDIDFDASTIKVTGKRDKQRFIPFGNELKRLFREYIESREAEFGHTEGAFFLSGKGQRIPRHQVYLLVKDALSRVSTVGKKSPHVLRHTFATSMLNHDAELGAVKELLGHNSLQTTEIYVHTTFKELKEIHDIRPFIRGEKRKTIILCKERNTAEKAALMLANFRTIDISGFQRSLSWTNIKRNLGTLSKLLRASSQAKMCCICSI